MNMLNQRVELTDGAPEEVSAVVSDLFAKLALMVTEYDDQAIKIEKRIDGTAFFPGGVGLWRGLLKNGPMPPHFPKNPVMMLAHNFDAQLLFDASVDRGIEKMDEGTWRGMREYLAGAELSPERCFFTNLFMGLKPGRKSRGKYGGSTQHKEQCREFLKYQLKRTHPCLVVVLGTPALEQFHMVECPYLRLQKQVRKRLRRSLLDEFCEAWGDLSPDVVNGSREQASSLFPVLIGKDESQPVIPSRVGLHRSPRPLHRPEERIADRAFR